MVLLTTEGLRPENMRLLETWVVRAGPQPRRIELHLGDLAAIPKEQAVDLLVLSAFPDDYVPTPTSLIGALDRRGLSVRELAAHKAVDLREAFSCWLSEDLVRDHPNLGFRHLLCFEPLTRGAPPELVGDVFRAIVPFVFADPMVRSVAMSLLAAGDERFDQEVMLRALLDASLHWLARGLPIEVVKIVLFHSTPHDKLRRLFTDARDSGTGIDPSADDSPPGPAPYDCFISYSRKDEGEVDALVDTLREATPLLRIFQDKLVLQPGSAWQSSLDQALESCRKVVAVLSPNYFTSTMCLEEFNMSRVRHRESGNQVLVPLYLHTAQLPLYIQTLNYIDCRDGELPRIQQIGRGPLSHALQLTA